MANNRQPTSSRGWQKTLAALLVVAGVAMIALSFAWPGKSSRRGAWSDAQAEQYQAASLKLHGLSHDIAHAEPDRKQAVDAELKKAKAEYDALRDKLDAARSRPQRLGWILRFAGLACLLLGSGALFLLPEAGDGQV
jgi:hypothetical protein